MKLKQIFLILILSISAFVSQATDLPSPVKSKEPLHFQSAQNSRLLDITKAKPFLGILTRENISDPISQDVDLFEFKNSKILELNSETCRKLAQQIYGELSKIALKLELSEIIKSKSKGRICHFVLADPDSNARIKQRHLFIDILRLHTYGYEFHFARPATLAQTDEISRFVESLR